METMWRFVDYFVKEESGCVLRSIVQIGDAYREDGGEKYGDDNIMFYFVDEDEFVRATKDKSEFDFVIVSWEDMEKEEE